LKKWAEPTGETPCVCTLHSYFSHGQHTHDEGIITIDNQQDATNLIYLFLISSTCFGRCFRPSSEAYHCNYSFWYCGANGTGTAPSHSFKHLHIRTKRWQRDASSSTQHTCPKIYSSATARQLGSYRLFGITFGAIVYGMPAQPVARDTRVTLPAWTLEMRKRLWNFSLAKTRQNAEAIQTLLQLFIEETCITLLSRFWKC